MTSHELFPAVLGVLDEADALEAQQAPVASLTRETLLQVTQALDTTRSPALLTQAVDAYLDRQTPPSAAKPSETAFSFGWARPTSEVERLAPQRTIERQEQWSVVRTAGAIIGIVGAILGVIGAGVFSGMWLARTLAIANGADAATRDGVEFVGLIGGALVGLGVAHGLVELMDVWNSPSSSTEACMARHAWSTGGCRPDAEYVQCSSTRTYLKGVMNSPLPRLMVGDQEQLEKRFLAAREAAQRVEAQRQFEEHARVQEEAQRERMATLRQALSGHSD